MTDTTREGFENKIEALQKEIDRLQRILDEWGITDKLPIKIVSKDISPQFNLRTTDSISLSMNNEVVVTKTLDTNMVVNLVCIYSFTDALGFNNVVAGLFGDKRDEGSINEKDRTNQENS